MKTYPDESAIVLLSGGQDSATALVWAKEVFGQVYAVTFRYGQRHECEVNYARRFAMTQGIEPVVIEMPWMGQLLGSSLGNHEDKISAEGGYHGLPNTFMPGRNMILLSIASSIAASRGISHVVGGMCETDFSGYPDCRRVFVDAFEVTFMWAIDGQFYVHTPLMNMDKAQTFALADQLGALGEIIYNTMTCYEGEETLYPWGRGCRVCPACLLRIKGFEKWKGVDCSQAEPIQETKAETRSTASSGRTT
jgi:7-cyano-7-deazaguanine synthase